MSSENFIAKGNYRHSRIANFISVKNYIFLRKNGVKCLLLRFVNELGYTVDGMSYVVFQYDGEGNLLGRVQVRHRDIRLNPLGTYATPEALALDEKCVDFKVVFLEVRSGKYRYRPTGDIVSVFYASSEELFDPEETERWEPDEPITEYSVERKASGSEKTLALIAFAIVLLMIFLNAMNMFFVYRKDLEQRENNTYGELAPIGAAVNFDDGERYVEV